MSEETVSSNMCKICLKNSSKYCCPRCNILYCSLNCYKSEAHIQCSESFYKDCVNEEMNVMDNDPASKKKMQEILSKLYKEENISDTTVDELNEMFNNSHLNASNDDNHDYSDDDINEDDLKDSDDEDSVPDLEERLREVNLDDADQVWEVLTEDEKKEFESLLSSRDMTNILPNWEPWWLHFKEKKMVEEISDSKLVKKEENYQMKCPRLINKVKDFSSLSKQNPAPCVKWNLLNVLSAYVFTTRLFFGEHCDFCTEAVSCLVAICKNLNSGANFDDAEVAIESVIQECHNNPNIASDAETKSTIIHDLRCLLRGPDGENKKIYIFCALSDLHTLLDNVKRNWNELQESCNKKNKAKGEFSKRFIDNNMCDLNGISKENLKTYIRKIEYYLSYFKDYGAELSSYFNS